MCSEIELCGPPSADSCTEKVPIARSKAAKQNHDTKEKVTFAVTSCSISFIRISAPQVGLEPTT